MQWFSVDRIEGDFAICQSDDGAMVKLLLSSIPPAREGDMLRYEDSEYVVDKEETLRRRRENAELQRRVFQKRN